MSDIIYHYSTARVLQSIFEKKELWASDVMYMNDAQELVYSKSTAEELIRSKIKSLGDHTSHDDPVSTQIATLHSTLDSLAKLSPDNYSYQRVYATCFCENGDLLSQWRAYGGSGGYAIGFKKDMLEKMNSPFSFDVPLQLQKIHYGLDEARPSFDEMTKSIALNPTGHPGVQGEYEFGAEVIHRLATVKNPAFSEEAEWRLIAVGSDARNLNFRESNLGLIPYVKFELKRDTIAEIIIGPGPEQHLRRDAIRQLIVKDSPSSNIIVKLSESPLRS